MSHVSLDDFLAAMGSMLNGTTSATQCEAVIGASPSGTKRLSLYQTLVGRQSNGAVESMFKAALVACRSWNQAKAQRLVSNFLAAHPPTHWSPGEVALPFAEFIQQNGAPEDVVALADFAKTRYQVLQAPPSEGIDGLAVRHYSHAVREFVVAVETGVRSTGRPDASPSTWLMGRHRDTAALVIITPSLPLLVALQVIVDGHWSDELPSVDKTAVLTEATFLVSQGLLSDSAMDIVRRSI